MHPPRRKTTTGNPELIDRLADWLVANCPFSTLTALTLLVVGALLPPISRPILVAAPIVVLDLSLAFWRRRRASPATPRTLRQ